MKEHDTMFITTDQHEGHDVRSFAFAAHDDHGYDVDQAVAAAIRAERRYYASGRLSV